MRRHIPSFVLGLAFGIVGSSIAAQPASFHRLIRHAQRTIRHLNADIVLLQSLSSTVANSNTRTELLKVTSSFQSDVDKLQSSLTGLRSMPQSPDTNLCTGTPTMPYPGPVTTPIYPSYPPVLAPPQVQYPAPVVTPVYPSSGVVLTASESDVNSIIQAMTAESFSGGQMRVLQSAIGPRYFTTSQVVRIIAVFSFETDKVDAAVMLYPHVIDTQQWYQVYSAFTFSSSKQEVQQRIGQ